jgi:hypothetical protein
MKRQTNENLILVSFLLIFSSPQWCLFGSSAGREQGQSGSIIRRQDHRQESAQRQGGLAGERDKSAQKVS